MEGFSFVTPVTGLNKPNTGKEDDDISHICITCSAHKVSHCQNLFLASKSHAHQGLKIIVIWLPVITGKFQVATNYPPDIW
jgi:hypothetical protein